MLESATNHTRGLVISALSITVCTAVGLLAKETAVMLPLYAVLAEWTLFKFRQWDGAPSKSVIGFFVVTLLVPFCIGLAWLLPGLLSPATWATRNFSLGTRLLTEARVVVDYIAWTLLPTPKALSFYHDDFAVSQGLLSPWSTLASIAALCMLATLAVRLRTRHPAVSLGLLWFLGAHLLTATILPLELVYEHRNYFASLGLLMVVVPILLPLSVTPAIKRNTWVLPGQILLGGLMILWAGLTAMTAKSWSSPLSLAQELAWRAPHSPRAQYELGRTYIIYSNYDPSSRFTTLTYSVLERAAALPGSSILPEQALIFMNSRMKLPIKDQWWDSMIGKLQARKAAVQDESSLEALVRCMHEGRCDLPNTRMNSAFQAAVSHPNPSARLLAIYGEFAWNQLGDTKLGEQMTRAACQTAPRETAYRISLIRMLASEQKFDEARQQLNELKRLNIGGYLDKDLAALHAVIPAPRSAM
jgi:hypothetical protein